MMFGLFKKKEPLVVGGHYRFYQYITNNPFDRSGYLTIRKIQSGFIQYQFSGSGNIASDSEKAFMYQFRPAELRPDELEAMNEDPIFTEDDEKEMT